MPRKISGALARTTSVPDRNPAARSSNRTTTSKITRLGPTRSKRIMFACCFVAFVMVFRRPLARRPRQFVRNGGLAATEAAISQSDWRRSIAPGKIRNESLDRIAQSARRGGNAR